MNTLTAVPLPDRTTGIGQIAEELVAVQISRGELNERDEAAMEIACKQAVLDAKTLHLQ